MSAARALENLGQTQRNATQGRKLLWTLRHATGGDRVQQCTTVVQSFQHLCLTQRDGTREKWKPLKLAVALLAASSQHAPANDLRIEGTLMLVERSETFPSRFEVTSPENRTERPHCASSSLCPCTGSSSGLVVRTLCVAFDPSFNAQFENLSCAIFSGPSVSSLSRDSDPSILFKGRPARPPYLEHLLLPPILCVNSLFHPFVSILTL